MSNKTLQSVHYLNSGNKTQALSYTGTKSHPKSAEFMSDFEEDRAQQ